MRTGKFDATRTSRPRISNGLMTKGVTLRSIMGWEALEGLPTDKRERLVNSSAERDPQPSRPKPS